MNIYLASKSPRRQSLLKQIGIDFDCINSEIDETLLDDEPPLDYVKRMATEKALAGWANEGRLVEKPLLAADTSVVLGSHVLGKPQNIEDAINMLKTLSGNTHQVITCVTVKSEFEQKTITSITDVTFGQLSDSAINEYVKTGDCFDKAGSYGIQGLAAKFISSISGSYSGVVGLPLFETSKLLEQFNDEPKTRTS